MASQLDEEAGVKDLALGSGFASDVTRSRNFWISASPTLGSLGAELAMSVVVGVDVGAAGLSSAVGGLGEEEGPQNMPMVTVGGEVLNIGWCVVLIGTCWSVIW